jgi:nitrite reductase (NADH) small subunit
LSTSPLSELRWIEVCALDGLEPGRGVAALVGNRQIAIFLLPDGSVRAIDNVDPYSRASVLSRGIVGSKGDIVTVASPVYKQRFDLRTGECIDEPAVAVDTFGTRVHGGRVEVCVEHDR